MPFVLIISGIILLTVAVRNTQDEFFRLLQGDFIGENNYVYWMLSILILGAIGYIPKLKPISDGFLILVILVLFIKKDTGFFAKFNQQIHAATASVSGGTTVKAGGLLSGAASLINSTTSGAGGTGGR